MKITLLIPHYKEGRATAFCVSKLLKYKGRHEIDIVVIDNNSGDGSIDYVDPFLKHITIVNYPKDKIQSHGISFDYVLPSIKTEYFITLESDSFPTIINWLDYYEVLTFAGYDLAGSLMQLSGGQYIHPCGALYKKPSWQEAKDYCDKIEYAYFPNAAMKEGFDCHLMVHKRKLNEFLNEQITGYDKQERLEYYKPVVAPFHNGMGRIQESIKTYGKRNIHQDSQYVILDNEQDFIYRIGYEPGQWLTYWMLATGKKIFDIPATIKWLPNRENQQQEYTLMENGLKHLWAGSSYLGMKGTDMNDVYEFKNRQIEELYESLPKEEKIPPKKTGF